MLPTYYQPDSPSKATITLSPVKELAPAGISLLYQIGIDAGDVEKVIVLPAENVPPKPAAFIIK